MRWAWRTTTEAVDIPATTSASATCRVSSGRLVGLRQRVRRRPQERPAAVTDIDSTLTSEVTSLNGLFDSDATARRDSPATSSHGTGVLPFDTIPLADTQRASSTPCVFGVNPASRQSADPGSYDVLNGALGEFDNAYNVELFSLLNGGDILPASRPDRNPRRLARTVLSPKPSPASFRLGVSDLLGYF